MRGPLSPHFNLSEFLPAGWDGSVPAEVLGNLIALAEELLEPARAYMGRPVHVHSGGGWRPEEENARVGGAKQSDHKDGRAGDIHVDGDPTETWEQATIRLFHWMRVHLAGRYGQLILEDHREHYRKKGHPGWAGKLWIHAAIPSPKHPGTGADPNAVLTSPAPKVYRVFEEPRA